MSKLGNIFRIAYEVKLDENKENVERLFVERLKIRNRNADGTIRYYNEVGETIKFNPFLEGGVFVESDFTDGKECIKTFFMTINETYAKIVESDNTGHERDQAIYDEVLSGLRKIAEEHAENIAKQKLSQIKEKTKGVEEKMDAIVV